MSVRIHPHCRGRMAERGTTEAEVVATVEDGEPFPAKFGRNGFRRNFACNSDWRGRSYTTKQVEAIAVREGQDWLVITVMVKFF